MKRALIFATVLTLACSAAYAQTEKGDQTLGLNFGISYVKSTNQISDPITFSFDNVTSKYTTFTIGPSYSYFIINNLDLGAAISYTGSTDTYPATNSNPTSSSSNTFSGMIYLRKYCMFGGKLGIRTGPYVGGSSEVDKIANAGAEEPSKSTTYSLEAGAKLDLVYYPSKRLGFAASLASLDYTHYRTFAGSGGDNNGDQLNLSLINNNLSLSVFFVFGK
jgi:hypothetical protein